MLRFLLIVAVLLITPNPGCARMAVAPDVVGIVKAAESEPEPKRTRHGLSVYCKSDGCPSVRAIENHTELFIRVASRTVNGRALRQSIRGHRLIFVPSVFRCGIILARGCYDVKGRAIVVLLSPDILGVAEKRPVRARARALRESAFFHELNHLAEYVHTGDSDHVDPRFWPPSSYASSDCLLTRVHARAEGVRAFRRWVRRWRRGMKY